MVSCFSPGDTRPCSSPSRRPDSSPAGQALEGLLGRAHLELLALVDERAHDVGLAPGGHLLADRGPHRLLVQLAVAGPRGDDRRATGRQLVEHRHVEVAVDGHGRGARDRAWRSSPARRARPRRRSCRAARPAARPRSGAARRSPPRRATGTRCPPGSGRGCRWPGRPRPSASPARMRRRSAAVVRLVSSSTRSSRSRPAPANRLASSVSGTPKPVEQRRARPGGAARPAPRWAP